MRDFKGLSEKTKLVREIHGIPMIQEYIPGKEKKAFYLVLDKQGQLKSTFSPRYLRSFFPTFPTSRESAGSHPYVPHAVKLVRKVGWWGGITVEMKVDCRDGLPKLMEINPRLGFELWIRTELGINEPMMCLKIARGEEVEVSKEPPAGILLLSPVEYFMGLYIWFANVMAYKFQTGLLGRTPIDPLNPPMTLKEVIRSYKQTYLNGKEKVFDPYSSYFLRDPLVSILWWSQRFSFALRTMKQLGL